MMRLTCRQRDNGKRGFTLTELAIVLGIIGSILGAIWVAAAKVYMNQKINKDIQEILTISQGVRALYANKGVINETAGDLSTAMVKFNVFPSDSLQTCGANTCAYNPWGVQIQVGFQSGWGGAATTYNNRFEIYQSGTFNGCPAIMASLMQSATAANIVWASATGIGAITAPATATIATVAPCTGGVVLQFAL